MHVEWHRGQGVGSKLPSLKELVNANTDPDLVVCVDSPYPEELERFKKLVADEKLDDLFARYPLRDSRVFKKSPWPLSAAVGRIIRKGSLLWCEPTRISRQAQTTYHPSFQRT